MTLTQTLVHGASKTWRYGKHVITLAFFALVIWLLADHAKDLDWQEVKDVLTGYSWVVILIGAVLALCTYTAYSSYDLFGRYYISHPISRARMMIIAFVSCAFTLNLGAMIGSIGFRYRMYTQHGMSKTDVTRIVGMTLTTNWLGYIFVAGWVFVTGSVVVPFNWAISDFALRLLGGFFIVFVCGYFVLCHFAKTRSWSIKGQDITLPSIKVALAQLAVSSTHWLLMCGILYSFLYTEIDYFSVLGVLLISSIAGIIAHIPGALGVLEAVFIALLGGEVAPANLFAALIAYRAVFYLWPLLIAVVVYAGIEISAKKEANQSPRAGAEQDAG